MCCVIKSRNCHVALAEPSAINLAESRVVFDDGRSSNTTGLFSPPVQRTRISVTTTGSRLSGPKTIEDATENWRRIPLLFEKPRNKRGQPDARRRSPSRSSAAGHGVEPAGAIMEIAAKTIPETF